MSALAARVDGARLWSRLMELARIGATPAGGVRRLALSEEDRLARETFREWAVRAGCRVWVDRMGNQTARREGTDADAPPVVLASHLDTQPTGGRFDGALGVLAGLEVIETLNDQRISTRSPIEVVNWTNEEGARFDPAMLASGVFAGAFEQAFAYDRTDANGVRFEEALEAIGAKGSAPCAPRPIRAAFELHIEQGPVLEAAEVPIGVVTGVQGIQWLDLVISGREIHAGPTPMAMRADPVRRAAELIVEIYGRVEQAGPEARVTFGALSAAPGSRNTVPGEVRVSVDLRHPDAGSLDRLVEQVRAAAAAPAATSGVTVRVEPVWHCPPVGFDPACAGAVRDAAAALGHRCMDLVSGAGHDSVYLSRVAPTAMIFIPCQGGVSHHESESIRPEHAAAGADVLLNAALTMAQKS